MTCDVSQCCLQAHLAHCLVEHKRRLRAITNFACESSVADIGIFLYSCVPFTTLDGLSRF